MTRKGAFLWIVALTLPFLVISIVEEPISSKQPTKKPTFIVNLDTSTVICQHSVDSKDLHLHDLSILCDGKLDCFTANGNSMNDENFPYCETSCGPDCSKHGACLLNGTRPECYCNAGFYGKNCESSDLSARADAKSKSIGIVSKSKSDAYAEVRAPKRKYSEVDEKVADFGEIDIEENERQKKSKEKINRQNEKQSGGFVLIHGASNSTIDEEELNGFELPTCGLTLPKCPRHSRCIDRKCICQLGFDWNRKRGRCEVNHFGLASKWPNFESTQRHFNVQTRKSRLQTTVYGEWKNLTGGQLIISRGQLFPQSAEWGLELTASGFGHRDSTNHSIYNITLSLPPNKLHKNAQNFTKSISTPRRLITSVSQKSGFVKSMHSEEKSTPTEIEVDEWMVKSAEMEESIIPTSSTPVYVDEWLVNPDEMVPNLSEKGFNKMKVDSKIINGKNESSEESGRNLSEQPISFEMGLEITGDSANASNQKKIIEKGFNNMREDSKLINGKNESSEESGRNSSQTNISRQELNLKIIDGSANALSRKKIIEKEFNKMKVDSKIINGKNESSEESGGNSTEQPILQEMGLEITGDVANTPNQKKIVEKGSEIHTSSSRHKIETKVIEKPESSETDKISTKQAISQELNLKIIDGFANALSRKKTVETGFNNMREDSKLLNGKNESLERKETDQISTKQAILQEMGLENTGDSANASSRKKIVETGSEIHTNSSRHKIETKVIEKPESSETDKISTKQAILQEMGLEIMGDSVNTPNQKKIIEKGSEIHTNSSRHKIEIKVTEKPKSSASGRNSTEQPILQGMGLEITGDVANTFNQTKIVDKEPTIYIEADGQSSKSKSSDIMIKNPIKTTTERGDLTKKSRLIEKNLKIKVESDDNLNMVTSEFNKLNQSNIKSETSSTRKLFKEANKTKVSSINSPVEKSTSENKGPKIPDQLDQTTHMSVLSTSSPILETTPFERDNKNKSFEASKSSRSNSRTTLSLSKIDFSTSSPILETTPFERDNKNKSFEASKSSRPDSRTTLSLSKIDFSTSSPILETTPFERDNKNKSFEASKSSRQNSRTTLSLSKIGFSTSSPILETTPFERDRGIGSMAKLIKGQQNKTSISPDAEKKINKNPQSASSKSHKNAAKTDLSTITFTEKPVLSKDAVSKSTAFTNIPIQESTLLKNKTSTNNPIEKPILPKKTASTNGSTEKPNLSNETVSKSTEKPHLSNEAVSKSTEKPILLEKTVSTNSPAKKQHLPRKEPKIANDFEKAISTLKNDSSTDKKLVTKEYSKVTQPSENNRGKNFIQTRLSTSNPLEESDLLGNLQKIRTTLISSTNSPTDNPTLSEVDKTANLPLIKDDQKTTPSDKNIVSADSSTMSTFKKSTLPAIKDDQKTTPSNKNIVSTDSSTMSTFKQSTLPFSKQHKTTTSPSDKRLISTDSSKIDSLKREKSTVLPDYIYQTTREESTLSEVVKTTTLPSNKLHKTTSSDKNIVSADLSTISPLKKSTMHFSKQHKTTTLSATNFVSTNSVLNASKLFEVNKTTTLPSNKLHKTTLSGKNIVLADLSTIRPFIKHQKTTNTPYDKSIISADLSKINVPKADMSTTIENDNIYQTTLGLEAAIKSKWPMQVTPHHLTSIPVVLNSTEEDYLTFNQTAVIMHSVATTNTPLHQTHFTEVSKHTLKDINNPDKFVMTTEQPKVNTNTAEVRQSESDYKISDKPNVSLTNKNLEEQRTLQLMTTISSVSLKTESSKTLKTKFGEFSSTQSSRIPSEVENSSTQSPFDKFSSTEASKNTSRKSPSDKFSSTKASINTSTKSPSTKFNSTEAGEKSSTEHPSTKFNSTQAGEKSSTEQPSDKFTSTKPSRILSKIESSNTQNPSDKFSSTQAENLSTKFSSTQASKSSSTQNPSDKFSSTQASKKSNKQRFETSIPSHHTKTTNSPENLSKTSVYQTSSTSILPRQETSTQLANSQKINVTESTHTILTPTYNQSDLSTTSSTSHPVEVIKKSTSSQTHTFKLQSVTPSSHNNVKIVSIPKVTEQTIYTIESTINNEEEPFHTDFYSTTIESISDKVTAHPNEFSFTGHSDKDKTTIPSEFGHKQPVIEIDSTESDHLPNDRVQPTNQHLENNEKSTTPIIIKLTRPNNHLSQRIESDESDEWTFEDVENSGNIISTSKITKNGHNIIVINRSKTSQLGELFTSTSNQGLLVAGQDKLEINTPNPSKSDSSSSEQTLDHIKVGQTGETRINLKIGDNSKSISTSRVINDGNTKTVINQTESISISNPLEKNGEIEGDLESTTSIGLMISGNDLSPPKIEIDGHDGTTDLLKQESIKKNISEQKNTNENEPTSPGARSEAPSLPKLPDDNVEIPETENIGNVPKKIIHVIKNVERFQNGTLKYWSTLVPIERETTERSPEFGIEISGQDLQTTPKTLSTSMGLEINGDDVNGSESHTKEYGLVIEGLTIQPPANSSATTVEITTASSRSTLKPEFDQSSQVPIGDYLTTESEIKKDEHGLVIEHIEGGWPNEVDTTTPEIKVQSTTNLPNFEIVTEGVWTSQNPDEEQLLLNSRTSTLSSKTEETTLEDIVLTDTPNKLGTVLIIESTTQEPSESTTSIQQISTEKEITTTDEKGRDKSTQTESPKLEQTTLLTTQASSNTENLVQSTTLNNEIDVQSSSQTPAKTSITPPIDEIPEELTNEVKNEKNERVPTTPKISTVDNLLTSSLPFESTPQTSQSTEKVIQESTTQELALTSPSTPEISSTSQPSQSTEKTIQESTPEIISTSQPSQSTEKVIQESTTQELALTSPSTPEIISTSQPSQSTEKVIQESTNQELALTSPSTPEIISTSQPSQSTEKVIQESTTQALPSDSTPQEPVLTSSSTSEISSTSQPSDSTTQEPALTSTPEISSTSQPSQSTEKVIQESTTQALPSDSTPQEPALTSSSTPASKDKYCVSNDECGVDAYCEKPSGICLCKKGFRGIPPSCSDINECDEKLDKCHPSSLCQNHVGGFSCQCAIGYRMNPDGICVDIDECAEKNVTLCNENARCQNLNGSYKCICKSEFGDGFTCYAKQKRLCTTEERNMSGCGRNHLCLINSDGEQDCNTCKHGFAMQFGVCSDINECSNLMTNQCHENAVCVNIKGSSICQCKNGYKGDGLNCVDIDECSTNPCHPQAKCLNLPGTFKCSCPNKWKGDGLTSCINPAETMCENKSEICTSRNNTSCLSTEVRGEMATFCECNEGYRWNSHTRQCDDIDECAEKRHNCNSTTSFCVNSFGHYNCQCLEGFEGSNGVCVDIDECQRKTHTCSHNEYCVNLIGRFSCTCADGYTRSSNGSCNYINDVAESDHPKCTNDWIKYCKGLNKTCFVEEDILQCGSCLNGYHPIDGKCQPINEAGNCGDPNKNDCDINANCIDVYPNNHVCVCKDGFMGEGRHCDDVNECSMPGICGPNSACQNTIGSYSCHCHPGYVWIDKQCEVISEQTVKSCLIDKNLCHPNAVCTIEGICRCAKNYQGDGISICLPIQKQASNIRPTQEQTYLSGMSSKIIQEITTQVPVTSTKFQHLITMPPHRVTIKTTTPNYCDTVRCHQFAICSPKLNACICRDGYNGDGKTCNPIEPAQPNLKVQCGSDGIRVILEDRQKPFVGHVFVNGQKDNPYCSKIFNSQEAIFFIPVSHCNMKFNNYSTLSTTIMVQRPSQKEYPHTVRCNYPMGTKFVNSKFGVKDLYETETSSYIAHKIEPTCDFSVTNLENIIVNSASVGQVMKLVLSVQPNDTHGIRPQNCFAINMETSEKYRLTDEKGCVIDTDLFPQWTQLSASRTQSIFRIFKWPDCRLIRFECDCSPCLGPCPIADCSRQTYRRRVRSNRQELENSTSFKNRTATSIVYVREKQEGENAQREFEEWLARDLTHKSDNSKLCFKQAWPFLIIIGGLLLLAVASILFLFHKMSQVKKASQKNLRHATSLGSLSSYIQF